MLREKEKRVNSCQSGDRVRFAKPMIHVLAAVRRYSGNRRRHALEPRSSDGSRGNPDYGWSVLRRFHGNVRRQDLEYLAARFTLLALVYTHQTS